MSVLNITSSEITSTDLKSTGTVSFNANTYYMTSPPTLKFGGYIIAFDTIENYLAFVNEVVIPLTNKVLSTSGDTGTGYIACQPGTPGLDKIKTPLP